MRGTFTLLGAACAALLAAAPTLAAQDFHWTGKLAAGKRLEIKGVNGAIRAMATSGDQIDVTAHKTARRSDPDEVEIKVVPFEDGVAICAVYPTPRRARRENSCEPGDDWSSSTDNNDVVAVIFNWIRATVDRWRATRLSIGRHGSDPEREFQYGVDRRQTD